MTPGDAALLLFLGVVVGIHIAALAFAIWDFYDSRHVRDDEDELVLQEVEKLRRLAQK